MSSIKYNIRRKMEWMGRRLRHIDGAEEIKEWAAAMSALNAVFKEVDIKGSSDNWRPWNRLKEMATNAVLKEVDIKGSTDTWRPWKRPKEMATKVPTAVNRLPKERGRPPRVEVEGDDIVMGDPKAAVMEMLKKGETSLQKKGLKGEPSLQEKKWNREIWRKGMLDRVKKENVPFEHWGTAKSGNFKIMIGECAPHEVRVAVTKDMGFYEVGPWLYKELKKVYDKDKLGE